MNRILFSLKNLLGFGQGHERTIRAKKNIAASFVIKGLNIATELALVPLTINYLNPTKYGIWITLSSIVTWFGFFDIGLGHGLRNRFAEAIAKGNQDLAKIYVSTTYAIVWIIVAIVLIMFYLVNPFINWNLILNAGDEVLNEELSLLVLFVFTFFCLQFVFKLITTILFAAQQPAKASLFDLFGKILALLIIFILTKSTNGSLLYLGITLSSAPVFVLLISNIWFFNRTYKSYSPSLKTIDLSKAKDLFQLGIKFFVIQISAIITYQTSNIIISHLFGPAEVTPYNVAFKYFSILKMGFFIILTPFWSAFTDAWIKHDIQWIKRTTKKLNLFWIILFFIGITMLALSKSVYELWVGKDIAVPFTVSLLVAIWIITISYNGIYGQFLNGLSKISLQLYLSVFGAIVFIPLAIFLGKKYGIEGILITNIILSLITLFVYPLQYKKILNNKAKGIWNR